LWNFTLVVHVANILPEEEEEEEDEEEGCNSATKQ
jgi:hypothetical protein